MKRTLLTRFSWLAIGCIIISCLAACENSQKVETEMVLRQAEALREAMINPTDGKLRSLTSAQLSYGHSSGRVEDQASFIENLLNGKSDFVEINLSEQTIAIEGATAIVRHILSAKTNDSGNPGEVNLRILLVFSRSAGEWKLLARQAVKIQ